MTFLNKVKTYIKTTRFKTTLWYSSLLLILEIIIGFVLLFYLYRSMHQQLDASLSKQAESIYNFVSKSNVDLSNFKPDSIYTSPDELVYDLIFEAVALNPRNTFIQVDYKNKTIFKTENLRNEEFSFPGKKTGKTYLFDFKDKKLSPYLIRAATVEKNSYQIGVAFPVDLIDNTLNNMIKIYIIIAPFFFILSIIGGAVISARSLSRIDSIIKKTDLITTQNLNRTIEGGEFEDEYGRLVRTMNKMISRIKTSIDFMNQFSISASHELKTPLTILRGELEIALKSDMTPDEYKEILQSNYEETLRLINIVDKLFLISRIDHSAIKLNKIKVNIKEFLEYSVNQLRFLGKDKNVEIKLNIKDAGYINLDVDLIRQVLFNLIENAVKYGKEGEPIIVCCRNINNSFKFSVINKGEGISQEEISKIFDRFYRVENSRSRKTGGTGLGLSIVKSIINLHNGEIFVNSEVGKETEFYFILNSKSQLKS